MEKDKHRPAEGTSKTLEKCPICAGEEFICRLTLKDQSISGETFQIWSCRQCGFCHTSPQPDEAHIGKYYDSETYVSHSESQTGIINFLYAKLQRYNLRYKYRLIAKKVPRGTWLDYGGGAGAFLEYCQSKGQEILGLEPDEKARKRAEDKNLHMIHTRELSALPEDAFSAVTMWHVLEHVHNPAQVLKQIHRVIKQEGLLVVAVPNLRSMDAHHYKEYWAGYDVPRHLWHFREKDVRAFAEEAGFEFQSKHPLKLDAFYVSMLSEKYMKWGSLIRGVWYGLRSNFHAAFSGYPHSSQVYIFRKQPFDKHGAGRKQNS